MDDDNTLRDGEVRRTPMLLRDGLDSWSDETRQQFTDAEARIKQRDGVLMPDGASAAMHRPGFAQNKARGFAVGLRNDARAQAYASAEAADAAAWQNHLCDADEDYPDSMEGQRCTVRSGEHQGSPGVVRNGVCNQACRRRYGPSI